MEDFITQLLAQITQANLWGTLTPMAGLVAVAIFFALGVRFLRRGVSGVSKGKAKI